MPQFCPKCGAMMADGFERCSACGARMQPRVMDSKTGFTWGDFFHYSAYSVGIALLALLVPLLLVLGCLLLYMR